MVKCLTHDPKFKGLNLATVDSVKILGKVLLYWRARGCGIVVECVTHDPKFKGSNPVSACTEKEKTFFELKG